MTVGERLSPFPMYLDYNVETGRHCVSTHVQHTAVTCGHALMACVRFFLHASSTLLARRA